MLPALTKSAVWRGNRHDLSSDMNKCKTDVVKGTLKEVCGAMRAMTAL